MKKFLMAVLAVLVLLPVTGAQAHSSKWQVVAPYKAKLERIARCESSGNWQINTGNGYSGGIQFSLATWRSVGGRGMPHQASKLEQMYRAVLVMKRRGGWGDWPVCGFR